jgi:hypothetical protein
MFKFRYAVPPESSAVGGGIPSNTDTLTTLMVPLKLLDKTILDLKSQCFRIDNQLIHLEVYAEMVLQLEGMNNKYC